MCPLDTVTISSVVSSHKSPLWDTNPGYQYQTRRACRGNDRPFTFGSPELSLIACEGEFTTLTAQADETIIPELSRKNLEQRAPERVESYVCWRMLSQRVS